MQIVPYTYTIHVVYHQAVALPLHMLIIILKVVLPVFHHVVNAILQRYAPPVLMDTFMLIRVLLAKLLALL